MSRWRPSDLNAVYVIPDIHGAYELLDNILTRILPLRKSDGGQDHLIFLGDYIDRHKDSHKVIDKLIELKKEYGDKVICLKGNHEQLMLQAMDLDPAKTNLSPSAIGTAYRQWTANGGLETIRGYLERAGVEDTDPWVVERFRISSYVPKEHLEFLQTQLIDYYELDQFLFVHGGCNPEEDIRKHDPDVLYWDRSLLKYVKTKINAKEPIEWQKTVITGHNASEVPVIHEKFMMLDIGSPKQLLVVELGSLRAMVAKPGKNRLVEYELKETESAPS